MQHANKLIALFPVAALLFGGLPVRAADATAASTAVEQSEMSVWGHHQVRINYYGITALYTCDGLEGKVRQILLFFGARDDLNVYASGCDRGFNQPSRTAWITADFYALAAASDAGASGAVQAHWVGLNVTPQRPNFMDAGDCELVEQMQSVLTKHFSLRGLAYRTSCVPHEVSLAGYSVTGEVLKKGARKAGGGATRNGDDAASSGVSAVINSAGAYRPQPAQPL